MEWNIQVENVLRDLVPGTKVFYDEPNATR
jgi:hypothetical protein